MGLDNQSIEAYGQPFDVSSRMSRGAAVMILQPDQPGIEAKI